MTPGTPTTVGNDYGSVNFDRPREVHHGISSRQQLEGPGRVELPAGLFSTGDLHHHA